MTTSVATRAVVDTVVISSPDDRMEVDTTEYVDKDIPPRTMQAWSGVMGAHGLSTGADILAEKQDR